MKKFLLSAVLLTWFSVGIAQTTNVLECSIQWDYSIEDQSRIDGFNLFVDGVKKADVSSDVRHLPCVDLGVTSGSFTLTASAFNAVGESEQSSPLLVVFVDSIPNQPKNIQIILP